VINPASYNFCAICIVLATEDPIFLLASCCNVDVVNGAEGDFFPGLTSISVMVYSAFMQVSKNF
jgi:hypothetical protein